ncbi:MAG: AtpZ/AtpI family protein [Candidatus Firestonebacteria bacterium]
MSDFNWGKLGFASGLGFTLALSTFGGLAAGYFLDKYLKTSPVFTLVLFVLGTAAGFYYIISEIRKMK